VLLVVLRFLQGIGLRRGGAVLMVVENAEAPARIVRHG
jgi:hypothetical protein